MARYSSPKSVTLPRIFLLRPQDRPFNVEKWEALVRYDPKIAAIADKLRPLGQRWVDEFARAYLALNDKQYLPNIVSQLLADARTEHAREQEEQRSAQFRSEQANAQRKRDNKVAVAIAVVVLAIAVVGAFLLNRQQEGVTAGTSEPQAPASLRADRTTFAPAAVKTTAPPPPEAPSPATPAKKTVTASAKRSASGDVPKGDPRDPNEANRRLLGLSEDDHRAAFYVTLNMSGEGCPKVTRTFYQGSAKPTWNALWSIECEGGPSYQVLVMSDEKGSTKVLPAESFAP
jgi:hypothetical protein